MPKPQGWNHNIHYHDVVLQALPQYCHRALDVGCGEGLLARQLAERCEKVVAIDRDRESLERARNAAAAGSGIDFIEGDVMSYPFSAASFDCVTAVAALHHLPLRAALIRFGRLLKPGGTLAVLGLYRESPIADYLTAAAALPVSRLLRALYGRTEVTAPMTAPETTLREIQLASRELLPGFTLKRHLLFRYSLVWHKPGALTIQ